MIFRIAFEGTALEINFGNPVFDNFYSEFESLLAHVFHKLGSGNRGRKTGEVFNVGRDCQLSAGLGTGDYGCRQSGSCCVNAGGITGGPEPMIRILLLYSAISFFPVYLCFT